MRDYYDTLGVSKTASTDEIKRAYRELAMKLHPDKNKSKDAEAKFKEINEAYAVLSNAEKRRQYDAYGPDQFNQRFSEEDIFRGFNTEDIFKDIFGFSGFDQFGGNFGNQAQEQAGVNLYLPFDDIEKGVDRVFEVQHHKTCSNCRGSGGEPGSKQVKCNVCNGSGRRVVQQNTMFGRFQMATPCNRCGGRGKFYEKICRDCNGNGKIVVKDKFRIKAEKLDGGNSDSKKKFWTF